MFEAVLVGSSASSMHQVGAFCGSQSTAPSGHVDGPPEEVMVCAAVSLMGKYM
jgi:hypothetical protein